MHKIKVKCILNIVAIGHAVRIAKALVLKKKKASNPKSSTPEHDKPKVTKHQIKIKRVESKLTTMISYINKS